MFRKGSRQSDSFQKKFFQKFAAGKRNGTVTLSDIVEKNRSAEVGSSKKFIKEGNCIVSEKNKTYAVHAAFTKHGFFYRSFTVENHDKAKFLRPEMLTPQLLTQLQQLNDIAAKRGQTLAQMALQWILKQQGVTSVLVGASSVEQLQNNLQCIAEAEKMDF